MNTKAWGKNMNNNYVKISGKEYILNISIIIAAIFTAAVLFYDSFLAGIIMLPLGIPILKQRKQKIRKRELERIEAGFKDFLIAVSDAMSTGYSIENAIKESYRDLLPVYGYESDICGELRLMISRLKLNVNVETVLSDFADRTELKNAKMFSQIFSVAKKTGGNMTEVIKSVTDDIVLKQSVKEEINTSIHAKKTEQKIMTAIPLILIVYVKFASPGFLDIMYQNLMGRIVMTVCMICYGMAFIWSEKITTIEI